MQMTITSPPILLHRPFIRPAGALASLLARSAAPVIGVAGASGKSTTAGLIAAMLEADGFKVTLGLVEALADADRLTPDDRVVVELTPPMIRGTPEGLALLVITGIVGDELAPGQVASEMTEALRRAAAGTVGGIVVNADCARALGVAAEAEVPIQRVSLVDPWADATLRDGELVMLDPLAGLERRVCRLTEPALALGNFGTDLLLASAAAVTAGAAVEAIRQVAGRSGPGPNQCEVVRRRHRVTWISDASATRPGRSAATLATFDGGLILIAGGRYGGQSLARWSRAVAERARYVLLFGSAGDALGRAIEVTGGPATIVRCADIEDAVSVAGRLAEPGDRVLFSPACEADTPGVPTPADQFRALLAAPGRRAEAA